MKRKEVLQIESITTLKQAYDLCDHISKKNRRKFNFTKLAEECNELADLCLKFVNKKSIYRPSKEKFIEELGDVITRIEMLTEAENISFDDVSKRVIYKANKFLGYIKDGKYDRGI